MDDKDGNEIYYENVLKSGGGRGGAKGEVREER